MEKDFYTGNMELIGNVGNVHSLCAKKCEVKDPLI